MPVQNDSTIKLRTGVDASTINEQATIGQNYKISNIVRPRVLKRRVHQKWSAQGVFPLTEAQEKLEPREVIRIYFLQVSNLKQIIR